MKNVTILQKLTGKYDRLSVAGEVILWVGSAEALLLFILYKSPEWCRAHGIDDLKIFIAFFVLMGLKAVYLTYIKARMDQINRKRYGGR